MKTYRMLSLISGIIIISVGCLSFGQKANSEPTIKINTNSRTHILADYVASKKIISTTYKAQVGKKIINPSFEQSRLQPSYFDATCDMFVPRQAVVHLEIPQVGNIVTQGTQKKTTTRVDVTAFTDGFESGSFSTIELNNVNKLEFLPQTSSVPLKVNSQVLFNQVHNWQIVDRPENLPIYRSHDVMLKSVPSMAKPLQAIIKEELRTGLLNQARILGKTKQMVKGKPYDVISIVGLAPGMTYQYRAVNKALSTEKTLSFGQLHIPVCPADFVP